MNKKLKELKFAADNFFGIEESLEDQIWYYGVYAGGIVVLALDVIVTII